MKKWKPFWLESNQAWGWIDKPSKWNRIKKSYQDTGINISDAKESTSYAESTGAPYFGFRSECKGPGTLGEFFKKHGMAI